jgi:phosphoglycolate phosphatase-like HAD superfamily hydrolase
MVKPDALALDFDGVICDGLLEYFQTAWRTYRHFWPEAPLLPPGTLESQFQRLRPVVETGWEMPVVLRSLCMGQPEDAILSHWPEIRTHLMVQEQLDPSQIGQQVDAIRDRWIAEDLVGWLSLHRFYPGISEQIQLWLQQDLPLFIITTKEGRFVQALLHRAGISFSQTSIFGKEGQRPKSETLKSLQEKGFPEIWFVEDRLETLLHIREVPDLQSVQLFLGDWGYNTERDRHFADNHSSLSLLTLDQFCQDFSEWPGAVKTQSL